MKLWWWKIRFKLSQWIYPHKCPEQPSMTAVLYGGPAAGKEIIIRGNPKILQVPILQSINVKAYNEKDLIDFDTVFPVVTETYRLRYGVYDYVPVKKIIIPPVP